MPASILKIYDSNRGSFVEPEKFSNDVCEATSTTQSGETYMLLCYS